MHGTAIGGTHPKVLISDDASGTEYIAKLSDSTDVCSRSSSRWAGTCCSSNASTGSPAVSAVTWSQANGGRHDVDGALGSVIKSGSNWLVD